MGFRLLPRAVTLGDLEH